MNETSRSRQHRSYDVDETVGRFLATQALQRHKSLQNLDSQSMLKIVPHIRCINAKYASISGMFDLRII